MRKTLTHEEVLEIIRTRVNTDGLRETARNLDIDPAGLSKVVKGFRLISDNIAAKFGFEPEVIVRYKKVA